MSGRFDWVDKLKDASRDPKFLVLLALFMQNSSHESATMIRRYVLGIAKVDVSYAEALLAVEMKILATWRSVCSVRMLVRSISSTRWRAVLLVLSSILVASRPSLGTTQYTPGVGAWCVESGVASTYFEKSCEPD